MTIKTLVRSGGVGLVLLLAFAAIFAAWRIDAIRMGGPVHHQSRQTADLIADILPPPAYIIEAYLEATLMSRDPADYAQGKARLAALHSAYETRLAFWQQSDVSPALRQALVGQSMPPAEEFWTELDTRFLPAVARHDTSATRASYRRLATAYATHRTAIDLIVRHATAYQTTLENHAAATLQNALIALALIGILIVGGVSAFCVLLLRRVVAPTVAISDATVALAAGRAAQVPCLDRTDELGQIAHAVEAFRRASEARATSDAAEALEQRDLTDGLARVLQTMAGGDLSKEMTIAFPPSYASVGEGLNRAVDTLRAMIKAVTATAGEIQGGAVEISSASQDLAHRTQSNAACLEQTSAALFEIDTRLKSSGASSIETMAHADSALESVDLGRTTARGAVEVMECVSRSAENIDDVVGGLDKIAFQTRVLAMNAAVEAGRAGDAGRGFAVVADLVSALAQRAEEEAKRARDQLSVTQAEIGNAVAAVGHVDGALQAIAQDVGLVHGLLGGIASDNQAQSHAMTEISTAIGSLDISTQQNAAMVEQTSAAVASLTAQVDMLFAHASAFTFEERQPSANHVRHRTQRVLQTAA